MKFAIFFSLVLFFSCELFAQETYTIEDFSEKYSAAVIINLDEYSDDEFKSGNGTIQVFEKSSEKAIISVSAERIAFWLHDNKVKANITELPYGEQSIVIYDDFNFDGVNDFALCDGNNSCYAGPSYQIYLADGKKFTHNEEFTRLAQEYCGMFSYDKEKKTIHTMAKSGCCWHIYSDFVVEYNIPKVVKTVEEDLTNFPFMNLTTTTWDGENMTETKLFTLNLELEGAEEIFSFNLSDDGKKAVIFYDSHQNTLGYALLTKDNSVEFYFPAEYVYENYDFEYLQENSQFILKFSNKNAGYEMYSNSNKVGINVKVDGKTYDLKGDVSTVKGDLKNLKNVKPDNVLFK